MMTAPSVRHFGGSGHETEADWAVGVHIFINEGVVFDFLRLLFIPFFKLFFNLGKGFIFNSLLSHFLLHAFGCDKSEIFRDSSHCERDVGWFL